MSRERLYIFDTTLRDGEQSPGFSMNLREKLPMGSIHIRSGRVALRVGAPIPTLGMLDQSFNLPSPAWGRRKGARSCRPQRGDANI